MATLAVGTDLTIAEILRRENPDGTLADMIDTIALENRILEDIIAIQCNNGDYHEDTLIASRPTGSERAFDQGVPKEHTVTEKLVENIEIFCSISEADAAKAARHPGGVDVYRAMEVQNHVKGMMETVVSRLLTGNSGTDPRQIDGIFTRSLYNTLQTPGTETVVFDNAGGNASATANKTRMLWVQWGSQKVSLIYSAHSKAGSSATGLIKSDDYGRVMSTDAAGNKYPVWQTWFESDFGLFIHDWRCIKVITNISMTNIDGVDDFAIDEDRMIDAYNQLEYGGAGTVIYASRRLLAQLQKRSNEKGNGFYTEHKGEGPFAHPVIYWDGIEIKRLDALSDSYATTTT